MSLSKCEKIKHRFFVFIKAAEIRMKRVFLKSHSNFLVLWISAKSMRIFLEKKGLNFFSAREKCFVLLSPDVS